MQPIVKCAKERQCKLSNPEFESRHIDAPTECNIIQPYNSYVWADYSPSEYDYFLKVSITNPNDYLEISNYTKKFEPEQCANEN